jgi:hypothetical protein
VQPVVDVLVLDAALRRYGNSVESVLVQSVVDDDETLTIDAVVRLRPSAHWVTVTIVAEG